MEPYGPLYHRNGARLYPKLLPVILISVAIMAAVAELILGITCIVH